ncbi:Rrf2 family transcriptional regulator [Pelagicoccus sp. SDUM812003]|uniref:RrF2 family transcriptional regulator n=1 Tax=Pelagicoccus sp. SDUM812003 TaxID=3041267 RepID=UPI00280D5FFC|nr:Rrf2 family transcriptional regulator [Pelagicoccus sp. SDUM812003]MDQ8202408.1 Rrf2 family transcriptional regulator [Pelagicoccus sp. SDUM812003]
MLKYGRTSQNAIMAMSRLAEVYDGGETRLSSKDIAKARDLPQPNVAKLLVSLSQCDLVKGAPGPTGGYWLARPPQEISLYEIVCQFEKLTERVYCPFGKNSCDSAAPCPLHQRLVELDQQLIDFLQESSLDVFVGFQRAPTK